MDSQAQRDEKELIARLARGEEAAMTTLYSRYSGALYGMLLQWVPQEELAAELLQDVFIKVWRAIGQYDPSKGRLYTWMARIARNTAIDLMRSRNYQEARRTRDANSLVSDAEKSGEEMVIEDEGLKKVLSGLDEPLRKIVLLLYFQGYTQREASEHLGIPLGTVKTRTRTALMKLRTYLAQEGHLLTLLLALALYQIYHWQWI